MLLAAAAIGLSGCGGENSTNAPASKPAATAVTAAAEPAAPEPALNLEEQGRVAFRICAVCHAVTDPNAAGYVKLLGPSLFGIYGASSAHQNGFDYSPAMLNAGLTWDDETLDAYIANPQKAVPANRMAFAGEPSAAKREALIAYLKTLK
jgi:cytochrome c